VAGGAPLRDPDETAIDSGLARAERPFALKPGDLHDLRDRLSNTMWDQIGILRTAGGIEAGMNELAGYSAELAATGLADGDRAFNLTWHDWLNLDSLLAVSRTIGAAAAAREDSRGAHFREDFPETGDLTTSANTRVSARSGGLQAGDLQAGDLQVEMVPVSFDIVKPGQSLIDDEAGAPPAAAGAAE
jgi:fumarate reductase flavoprotein subunit